MYISKLALRNYRNFRNSTLQFHSGINTIIGENGSGKTNVVHALRLLIDESLPRKINFYESDFNRSIDWKGHWIIVQIEFAELDPSEECQAIAMHKAGSMEEYDDQTGSYSLIFRPNEAVRKELFEYSELDDKTEEGLLEILENITLNDYELTYRGRGNIDFSVDENYIKYVGDFENIIFPSPEILQEDVYGTRLFGYSIPHELSCTFIKALRDVESDLRSYRDNPLLNLLRGKEKDITVAQKDSIETKISELNEEISELKEVQTVSLGISDSMKQAIGETYAPNIDIRSELPSEMEKLLQSLKLWVGDPDEEGYKGRIWELSLGGANLVYFSLKLLEYENIKSQDKIANFLLIEEPEAHIHNHIQKTLFQKLHNRDTQIIITTHSTNISSVSKISAMNVLSRSNKTAEVYNPSNGLSGIQIRALERYLDAVRTNLLFAKGVLLVEGDAEEILIPQMVKKAFGVSLDEIGVSLVNIGSTGFQNVAIIFDEKRIKKKCSIVTDLDTSILKLPADEKDDTAELIKCRNSQTSGADRKVKLDALSSTNKWVTPFYGKHTFEVEFVKAGNTYEIQQVVNKEYKRKADKERINALLADSKVEVYGKEVLRLADSFGKGWFALTVTEYVDHLITIPVYILKAMVNASPHINEKTLLSMARYRLSQLAERAFEEDETDYEAFAIRIEKCKTISEALTLFQSELIDDPLSKLMKLIYGS